MVLFYEFNIYKFRWCGFIYLFNIDKIVIWLECKFIGRRGYEEEKGRIVFKWYKRCILL